MEGFIFKNLLDIDFLVLSCIKGIWKMFKRFFDLLMFEDLIEVEFFLINFLLFNLLFLYVILCFNIFIVIFILWLFEK